MAGPSHERAALRALQTLLPGGLPAGRLGSVCAPPGVGKTQLLIYIALERLLAGVPVLHIASREKVAAVRDAYDSILNGLFSAMTQLERAEAALKVERRRVIHSTAGRPVDVGVVSRLLDTLADALDARPQVVVVDGASIDAQSVAHFRALAADRAISLWCTYGRDADETEGNLHGDIVLELVTQRGELWLRPRAGLDHAPLRLAGDSFAAPAFHAEAPSAPLAPNETTLYSGGAAGAEAAFGEAAERWGCTEVNFTFAGHQQVRSRGAHPLTARELAEGDVSLNYVSRRLRRSYSESSVIRRVLQSLWHQVKSAQAIYVVGTIQEDGTVTGGTGWSVELARMWNKRLWVFDQDKDDWYRWVGDEWVAGTPTLDSATFCGTGTKVLTPAGRAAIDSLFERAFGAKVG